jgi:hypothetical protein
MIYWGEHFERFFEVFIRHGAVVDVRNLSGIKIGEANGNGNSHHPRTRSGMGQKSTDQQATTPQQARLFE